MGKILELVKSHPLKCTQEQSTAIENILEKGCKKHNFRAKIIKFFVIPWILCKIFKWNSAESYGKVALKIDPPINQDKTDLNDLSKHFINGTLSGKQLDTATKLEEKDQLKIVEHVADGLEEHGNLIRIVDCMPEQQKPPLKPN